jgi:hypothetical protein
MIWVQSILIYSKEIGASFCIIKVQPILLILNIRLPKFKKKAVVKMENELY